MAKKTGAPDREAARQEERARTLVREIVRQHFGASAKRLFRRGGGLTNLVFEFHVEGGEYVVRLNADATKIQAFYKEQWAMDAARAAGVPAPSVLEVGNEPGGFAYMVQEKVQGPHGAEASAKERLSLLRQLGELAARLHKVQTHGYGTVFDWSSNTLSRRHTWADYLDQDLEAERRIGVLEKHRLLTPDALKRLTRQVAEMRRWRARPALNHGDLRLKNVIADPNTGGIAAIIDWDESVSAPPPFFDLVNALHDLWHDEKEAFLAGYGMKPAALERMMPSLRAINALQYAKVVDRLPKNGSREQLAWIRLRLGGGLDLTV